jgi:hypothetical protein
MGMSYEEAKEMRLDSIERAAIAIIMSEHEGGRFNWNTLDWDKPQ